MKKKPQRKKPAPGSPRPAKLYRPTVDRRLDKTEEFFERVRRQGERRLFAHNLKKPTPEDFAAVQLIQQVCELAGANRGKVRQPTLAISA